jgi:hypothetical protein
MQAVEMGCRSLQAQRYWGNKKGAPMGIDRESDQSANLQIGPTTLGMVRIYVEQGGIEIPMDFSPEEAEEIAEELRAAAAMARRRGGAKDGR